MSLKNLFKRKKLKQQIFMRSYYNIESLTQIIKRDIAKEVQNGWRVISMNFPERADTVFVLLERYEYD